MTGYVVMARFRSDDVPLSLHETLDEAIEEMNQVTPAQATTILNCVFGLDVQAEALSHLDVLRLNDTDMPIVMDTRIFSQSSSDEVRHGEG
jgi:hypothetical protein